MSFLPGHFPGGAAAVAAGLTSITQVASASSTASTVTCPTVQAGDLLVLWDCAANTSGSAPAATIPSGFTQIRTGTLGFQRALSSYKLATGSESGSSLTGMSGNQDVRKVLVVFRGNVPIAVATPNTWGHEITANNPVAQSVTASGGTPPLVIFGGYRSNSAAVDPRTFTVGGSPAKDGEVASTSNLSYLAWKIYNSSPADVSVDMDDEGGTNMLQSGYIACS